jgi:hypothetical protein
MDIHRLIIKFFFNPAVRKGTTCILTAGIYIGIWTDGTNGIYIGIGIGNWTTAGTNGTNGNGFGIGNWTAGTNGTNGNGFGIGIWTAGTTDNGTADNGGWTAGTADNGGWTAGTADNGGWTAGTDDFGGIHSYQLYMINMGYILMII